MPYSKYTITQLESKMRKLRKARSSYRKDGYMRADVKRKLQGMGASIANRRKKKSTTKRRRR